mgnify:CR=1 FL=1
MLVHGWSGLNVQYCTGLAVSPLMGTCLSTSSDAKNEAEDDALKKIPSAGRLEKDSFCGKISAAGRW